MYLSDKDIRAKLSEMQIEVNNSEYPFNPNEQVQPCSIDLRLSNIFWEPMRVKSIDLRRSRLLDLSPRRYWKKRILQKGECITLKPGRLLLGRIYEKFTIPVDCGGKIEGRSSFARMGLGIHCTGDFINPGYRGHMPLQLFNYSPNPIKIFAYIPICQLMLIRVSNEPLRKYGLEELQSKYMDDDGGPSYWWRDKRIKSLQNTFQEVDVSIDIQERILDKIGAQEPEILERFEKFIEKIPKSNLENADNLLELFLKSEKRKKLKDQILKGIYYAMFPTLGSASAGVYFSRPFTLEHYILWCLTAISVIPFIHVLKALPKQYLEGKTLKNE